MIRLFLMFLPDMETPGLFGGWVFCFFLKTFLEINSLRRFERKYVCFFTGFIWSRVAVLHETVAIDVHTVDGNGKYFFHKLMITPV